MGAEDQTWIFILYRKQTTEPFSQPFWITLRLVFKLCSQPFLPPEMYTCCGLVISALEHLSIVLLSFQRPFFYTLPHLLHFYKQLITSLIL